MGSYEDLRNILGHIKDVTHDPNAWQKGLTPQQIHDVHGWLASEGSKRGFTDPETGVDYEHRGDNTSLFPQVPDDALGRIRGQHPGLFDDDGQMRTPPAAGSASQTPPAGSSSPAPPEDDPGHQVPVLPTDEQNKGDAAKAVKTLDRS